MCRLGSLYVLNVQYTVLLAEVAAVSSNVNVVTIAYYGYQQVQQDITGCSKISKLLTVSVKPEPCGKGGQTSLFENLE